jgi:hypothetical protein
MAVILYLVSLGKHPIYEPHNGRFRNIEIHKTLTQTNFVILLSVLVFHFLPRHYRHILRVSLLHRRITHIGLHGSGVLLKWYPYLLWAV